MIKINCDLCGKEENSLLKALIESVELEVCQNCSKFGKVIGPIKKRQATLQKKKPIHQLKEEKIELIVDNFSQLIKKRREELNLSQKDFALKINEKESTIHHIESGHFEPSLDLARKLEKILGIKLIEEHEENIKMEKRKEEEGFTLGDFIKIKK